MWKICQVRKENAKTVYHIIKLYKWPKLKSNFFSLLHDEKLGPAFPSVCLRSHKISYQCLIWYMQNGIELLCSIGQWEGIERAVARGEISLKHEISASSFLSIKENFNI